MGPRPRKYTTDDAAVGWNLRQAARVPAMMTYEEAKNIVERLSIIETKIEAAFDFKEEVKDLQNKVQDIELTLASSRTRRETWRWLVDLGWAALLAAIAAGVWLPGN